MNRAQYTTAVMMIFVRDTAVERGIPKRKQIEVDAAVNSLGLDPSELSYEEKQQAFRDLAELRVIHSDGERWFLAPELADWMRLPEDALETDEAGKGPRESRGAGGPPEGAPHGGQPPMQGPPPGEGPPQGGEPSGGGPREPPRPGEPSGSGARREPPEPGEHREPPIPEPEESQGEEREEPEEGEGSKESEG